MITRWKSRETQWKGILLKITKPRSPYWESGMHGQYLKPWYKRWSWSFRSIPSKPLSAESTEGKGEGRAGAAAGHWRGSGWGLVRSPAHQRALSGQSTTSFLPETAGVRSAQEGSLAGMLGPKRGAQRLRQICFFVSDIPGRWGTRLPGSEYTKAVFLKRKTWGAKIPFCTVLCATKCLQWFTLLMTTRNSPDHILQHFQGCGITSFPSVLPT